MRGMSGGVRSSSSSHYTVSLYELLKSYANHIMKKNFLSINIPKLPVFTTEQGIEIIKSKIKNLSDWRNIFELVPNNFKANEKMKRSGAAGIFSASLELTREGLVKIMQKRSFDEIFIKEKNE